VAEAEGVVLDDRVPRCEPAEAVATAPATAPTVAPAAVAPAASVRPAGLAGEPAPLARWRAWLAWSARRRLLLCRHQLADAPVCGRLVPEPCGIGPVADRRASAVGRVVDLEVEPMERPGAAVLEKADGSLDHVASVHE